MDINNICTYVYTSQIFYQSMQYQCPLYIIININGDLTADFSWPIELIESSPSCHNQTKKHNFQVIK